MLCVVWVMGLVRYERVGLGGVGMGCGVLGIV